MRVDVERGAEKGELCGEKWRGCENRDRGRHTA